MPSVNWVSQSTDQDSYKRFFHRGTEGGYSLISKYLHNGSEVGPWRGRTVPVNLFSTAQIGSGEKRTASVENVTPTQQTLEIARSEMKREEDAHEQTAIKKSLKPKSSLKPKPTTRKTSAQKSKKQKSKPQLTPLEKSMKKTSKGNGSKKTSKF